MNGYKSIEEQLHEAITLDDIAKVIELTAEPLTQIGHYDVVNFLWITSAKRNEQIIRILLNKLPDPHRYATFMCEIDEWEKLMFCIENDFTFGQRVLNDPHLLHVCVQNNTQQTCEYLIGFGLDVNCTRGINRNTPLHDACLKSRLEIVKLLCASPDIDINKLNSANFSALHFACKHDNLDIVKVLLAKSIDVNIINTFDCTALAVACDSGSAAIVRHLLSVRVELNLIVDVRNPFIQAYQQRYPQLFQN